MAESPGYAILGRGRRALRMRDILAGEGRRFVPIEDTRRQPGESEISYKSRLSCSLAASRAQIAWLCVPPGQHVLLMMEAAIGAGLHAVVEKPWFYSRLQSESLLALARERGVLVAVHYEFCLLEEVETWRNEFNLGEGLQFGGHFTKSGSDRLGIPAIENLGCHLLAIRAYSVPQSGVAEIRCGYEQPAERCVWLERQGGRIASIDFLGSNEPVTQRFIGKFEGALDGADFPLGLDLALRVSEDVDALR